VLRAIALIAVPALLMSAAIPPCFAGDQDSKQQTTKPAQKKPEMKSRGFHPAKPSEAPAAMPVPAPRGDGGSAEDTIGGLPGHSSGPGQDKQP
jgi:hypothetical protein